MSEKESLVKEVVVVRDSEGQVKAFRLLLILGDKKKEWWIANNGQSVERLEGYLNSLTEQQCKDFLKGA